MGTAPTEPALGIMFTGDPKAPVVPVGMPPLVLGRGYSLSFEDVLKADEVGDLRPMVLVAATTRPTPSARVAEVRVFGEARRFAGVGRPSFLDESDKLIAEGFGELGFLLFEALVLVALRADGWREVERGW